MDTSRKRILGADRKEKKRQGLTETLKLKHYKGKWELIN